MSPPDRRKTMALIDEAVAAGARRAQACEELDVSVRTVQRWVIAHRTDGLQRYGLRPRTS